MVTTTKKKRPVGSSFKPRTTRREPTLPELAFQVKGWDPRITMYLTPKEALKIKREKNFISQVDGPHTVGKWQITALGALHRNDGDSRIVEVIELAQAATE